MNVYNKQPHMVIDCKTRIIIIIIYMVMGRRLGNLLAAPIRKPNHGRNIIVAVAPQSVHCRANCHYQKKYRVTDEFVLIIYVYIFTQSYRYLCVSNILFTYHE